MYREELELNNLFKTHFLCHPFVSNLVKYIEIKGYSLKLHHQLEKGCGGYFDMIKKEIGVSIYHEDEERLLSPSELTFYLAHETRHLSHFILEMFPAYYNFEFKKAIDDGSWDPFKESDLAMLQNPVVGLAAELDCDRFAEEYVKLHVNRNFEYLGVYPIAAVAHYGEYLCKRNDENTGVRKKYLILRSSFERFCASLSSKSFFQKDLLTLKTLVDKTQKLLHICNENSFVKAEAEGMLQLMLKKIDKHEG